MTNISTDPLPCIVIETGDLPTHTVLWMHGLGADGNDFVPIVNELDLQPSIHTRFVFPNAPIQPVTINGGTKMRAWYDIFDVSFSGHEDIAGIHASQYAIETLIKREEQNGIKPENIILAGFSQGGVIALHTGLRYSNKLAGIMALSCYLPLAQTLATESHQANLSTPIFMAHGSNDQVIPIELATLSKEQLLKLDYYVKWNVYLMEHSVCIEEITDISKWLKQVLK
jgi:phospholipase/carboxylesterase